MKRAPIASKGGRLFALGWALFALQTLANCSGTVEHTGSPTGNAGTNTGKGGSASGGSTTGGGGNSSTDGATDNGGTSSGAGMSGYVGYGGHTESCFGPAAQCGFGCPPCPNGGSSGGGSGGTSGATAGGEAGNDAGGEAGAAGAAPAKRVASAPRVRSSDRSCYQLSGFENDACLPADDSLLAWLSPLPSDCTPTVLDGPELVMRNAGRACCYAVACEPPAR
ncbi:MAG TPA: hypothetical protein VHB79_24675 [Polyangiaceae bacterium]|nr:hypothetical protein [Polyangiaceae bacterium]